MNRIIALFAVFLFAAAGSTNAQISAIGGNLGTNYLVGDSPIMDGKVSPNIGVFGIYDLSSHLQLKFQVGYGKLDVLKSGSLLKTNMIPVEIAGLYSLPKFSSIRPFLKFGVGGINFSTTTVQGRASDALIFGGLGMTFPIGERLSFLASADARLTTGDDFNGYVGGLPDGYVSVQAGLAYQLKKPEVFRRKEKAPKEKILAQQTELRKESQPGTGQAPQDIYLELVKLRSKVEQLENELAKKDAQLQELETLVKIKDNKISLLETQIAEYKMMSPGQPAESKMAVNRTTSRAQRKIRKAASSEVRKRYKMALQNFQSRHYHAAIQELQDLYNNYPQHRLASNFIYWIGESYYALGKYDEAIQAFNKVLNFKRSPKLDDALLMAGLSYLRKGQPEMASKKFQELLKRFPNSEYAGKARRYLQSIQREVIS